MTTLEILKAARELLSVPERWTKRAFGRDSNGESLGHLSRFLLNVHKAVCFCSQGYRLFYGTADRNPGQRVSS